ncbi:MAG: hypothetical protein ACYC3S_10280 [Chloroflexota bacterium]
MHRTLAIAAFLAILVVFGIAGVLAQSNSPAPLTEPQAASPVTASATFAAKPTAPSGGTAAQTRTNEGNGVTVKVTWQGPASGPVFAVAMDTHSGSLDYNLAETATLRNDQGVQVRGSGWDGATSGHHVGGTLSFPTTAADGTALIRSDTKFLELAIPGVGGVAERKFRWDLPR